MKKQRLVDEKVAAEMLGMAVQTLRNWRFQGRGPRYFKLGKSIRYSVDELNEFIEGGHVRPVDRTTGQGSSVNAR